MKKLIRVAELAERWSYRRETIYNLVCQKKIPFIKRGRSIYFDIEEIEKTEKHIKAVSI